MIRVAGKGPLQDPRQLNVTTQALQEINGLVVSHKSKSQRIAIGNLVTVMRKTTGAVNLISMKPRTKMVTLGTIGVLDRTRRTIRTRIVVLGTIGAVDLQPAKARTTSRTPQRTSGMEAEERAKPLLQEVVAAEEVGRGPRTRATAGVGTVEPRETGVAAAEGQDWAAVVAKVAGVTVMTGVRTAELREVGPVAAEGRNGAVMMANVAGKTAINGAAVDRKQRVAMTVQLVGETATTGVEVDRTDKGAAIHSGRMEVDMDGWRYARGLEQLPLDCRSLAAVATWISCSR